MASVQPRPMKSGAVAYRVMERNPLPGAKPRQLQKTFIDYEDAEKFRRNVDRLGWDNALKVWERGNGHGGVPTLREWVHTYLDPNSGVLTGIDPGTRDKYAAQAEHFLTRLGDLPLDEITKDDVGAWIEWQLTQTWQRGPHTPPRHYSSATVKFMHGVLSNAYKAAVEREIVTRNPAYRAKIKNTIEGEPVFLSRDQYERLYAAMNDHYKPFTQFLVGTQCRFSEAAALRWGSVIDDTTPNTVRISRTVKSAGKGNGKTEGVTKTRRSRRTISLWPGAVDMLGERRGPNDYVFRSPRGARLPYSTYADRFWAAVKKAGLQELHPTPHDLRHTGASWLIADGVPLTFIQARLGHESIKTTSDTYGHLLPDAHTRMAASVGRALSPITPGQEVSADPR